MDGTIEHIKHEKKDKSNSQVSIQKPCNCSWLLSILSLAFLFAYVAIQFYVIRSPDSHNEVVSARVQDILVMIISYYFGSSHAGK